MHILCYLEFVKNMQYNGNILLGSLSLFVVWSIWAMLIWQYMFLLSYVHQLDLMWI